jgi:hypothetical protein
MSDPVNNPAHYQRGAIECIQAIEAMTAPWRDGSVSYCLGNVLKYIWRHSAKESPLEDLKKAAWYLDRAITLLGVGNRPTSVEEENLGELAREVESRELELIPMMERLEKLMKAEVGNRPTSPGEEKSVEEGCPEEVTRVFTKNESVPSCGFPGCEVH